MAVSKRDLGIQGIAAWLNGARYYIGDVTTTDIVKRIDKESGTTWLDNFGGAYRDAVAETSTALVNQALEKLGTTSKGKVSTYPDGTWRGQEFFDTVFNRATTVDFSKAVIIAKDTASATGEKIANAAKIGGISLVIFGGIALGAYLFLSRRNG